MPTGKFEKLTYSNYYLDAVMTRDLQAAQDFATVLAKRSAEVPNRPWIVTDQRSYSYRTMDERSSRLAKGLNGLGIGANDTVLVMLPDTVDFVLIWCALSKLGAIEVPVNIHYRGNLFTYLVNDSMAQTMVVDTSFSRKTRVCIKQILLT